jgi:hypothetical protein
MSRISLHPEEKPIAVYRTDFEIEASAEQVWAVLVDFESYADWNPSLPAISGELREGSTVSLTLAMPGRPPLTVKAQLQEVTPTRRLTWHGNVGADWLFAGDRQFAIHPLAEEKVRFTHVEDVHGLLFLCFGCWWVARFSATTTPSTVRWRTGLKPWRRKRPQTPTKPASEASGRDAGMPEDLDPVFVRDGGQSSGSGDSPAAAGPRGRVDLRDKEPSACLLECCGH